MSLQVLELKMYMETRWTVRNKLYSLGIYALLVVGLVLANHNWQFSDSAFDVRPVLLLWPCVLGTTLLYVGYRKTKSEPKGFLMTANHVTITALGIVSIPASIMSTLTVVLLLGLYILIAVTTNTSIWSQFQ